MTTIDDSQHDLPPGHEADVSSREADALDARLNEVSHSTGRATAWSRFGPKRRSRMRETASVPDFAQAFHQRVDRAEAADAGFSGLDPTLWEQIMASTGASGAVTTPSAPNRPTAQPVRGGTRPAARPPANRPFWTGFANATLAVVLLLAVFGVWRVYDRSQDSPPPTEPQALAFQPDETPDATQSGASPTQAAPGDIPPTVENPLNPTVEPAAIAESAFTCDFSSDMPIFQQVDVSPVPGTALLVTTSGDLVLTCPEEPNPVVLLNDVGQAWPLEWPGIVRTVGLNDEGLVPATYVNILTGDQVTLAPTAPNESSTTAPNDGRAPWVVMPVSGGVSGEVTLLDLRTLESSGLSAFFPPNTYPPSLASMSSTNSSGVLAVALRTPNSMEGNGALYAEVGWPGAVLIANGSLDDTHWIDVPDDLTDIQEMVLSPDGDLLALRSTVATMEPGVVPTTIYSVIRTDTGKEVGRTEEVHRYTPEMRWAADGDAMVFIDDTGVSVMDTRTGNVGRLLESSDDLQSLRSTVDAYTVLVTRVQAEEVATETPDLVRPQTFSINLQTGAVVTIEGVDVSLVTQPWTLPTQLLVMADRYPVGAGPFTFRVVNAMTGEDVGVLEDVEYSQMTPDGWPRFGPDMVVATPDGMTEVIGFGGQHIYLLQLTVDGAVITHLPAPGGDANTMVNLVLSPDGRWLSATREGDEARTRFLFDLTTPEADWIEVPSTVPGSGPATIFFVMGTGD